MRAGIEYLDDKGFKPFVRFRRITKGRQKGRMEIEVREAYGKGLRWVKRVVDPERIKRYPQEA